MLKTGKSVCPAVSSGTAVVGPSATFADRVAEARSRLGLAKSELALKAGLAPRTVSRIAAFAGLRHGRHRTLTAQIDRSWDVVRDHFATVQIPNSPLRGYGDPLAVAERIIAVYFAAAFHLSRDPDIDRDHLRALVGE
jgi:hypothetical protein